MSESVRLASGGRDPGRRQGVWPALVLEATAVFVVLALVFAKLAEMSGDGWRAVFLANGDSLVLPLLLQSFERGEPFDWVFSSQTFFFPEFPLYAICAVIMGSPQAALVLNAILNVLLLYVGFRAVTAAFAPGRRFRQVVVALVGVGLFLVATLAEASVRILGAGTVELSRITTVFLMTTYYSGALLVSLGMLALILWVSRRFQGGPADRRRVLVYAAVAIVVSGAATYSNPLYVLWFLAPFGAALLVLLIVRRLTLRWVLILAFPQVLGLGAGMLARVVFARYIAANLDHYLSSYGIPQAAELLVRIGAGWLGSPLGILQLLILLVPIAGVTVFLVRHGRRRATVAELFLASFILLSIVSLLAVQIGTGQSVTRYLLPLFVFPPLGLLLVRFEQIERRARSTSRRLRVVVAVALAGAAALTVGVSAPAVADLGSPRSPVDTACLADWLATRPDGGRQVNGVGSFWTVRALALYGTQTGRLVQVVMPLSIHDWMTNLALYDGADFSYVIVDRVITGSDIEDALGSPSAITRCDGFRIYDYAGTHGETVLNADILRSADILRLDHP